MMKTAVGLAGLAVTATAIMIPSTDSIPELSQVSNTIKGLGVVDPKEQLLKVDCSGCLFAQKDSAERLIWTQGVENALVLNISVGEAPETLELNGVRFYPPVMSMAEENPVPYIPQVAADMKMKDIRTKSKELQKDALRLTSWAFQAGSSQTVSESGEELLTIHLQLEALERQPITVPDIAITTLKNAEGQLMIVKIEMADKDAIIEEQCKDWPILCKWRQIIADKLSALGAFKPNMFGGKKPCPGAGQGGRPEMIEGEHPHHGGPPPWVKHGGPPPWVKDGTPPPWVKDGTPPPWVKHGHHGPPPWVKHGHHGPPPWVKHGHGRHGHHGHAFHRFAHAFYTIMITIVTPILLGLVAGMLTYLIGMTVGTVIARFRGRRERYQAVALDEDEFEVPGEYDETPRTSVEFLEKGGDEEALPVYVEKE